MAFFVESWYLLCSLLSSLLRMVDFSCPSRLTMCIVPAFLTILHMYASSSWQLLPIEQKVDRKMTSSGSTTSSGTAQHPPVNSAGTSKDKMTKITDLPVEIHTQILSELPINNVVQVRGVSRLFHDLVDQNESTLFGTIQRRNLARIEDTVSKVLTYDPSTTEFIDAFFNFLAHRRLKLTYEHKDEFRAFASHWLWTASGVQALAYDHYESPWDWHFAIGLIMDIAHIWDETHNRKPRPGQITESGNEEAHRNFRQRLNRTDLRGAEAVGLDFDDCQELYDTIKTAPKGKLPASIKGSMHREKNFPKQLGFDKPDWPLTQLSSRLSKDGKEKFARMSGIVSVEDLVEMLGVPEFPMFGDRGTAIEFAYCVETEQAYNIVKSAVAESRQLLQAEKAKVLEELFLF